MIYPWINVFKNDKNINRQHIHIMSQAENTRRKITKILQNLSIELDRVGLADKFEYKTTADPWIDLENAHSNLVSIIQAISPGQEEEDDKELKNSNQGVILDVLRYFVNIHVELGRFSKLLFQGNYSLDIYKAYRKLYEEISVASNSLYQFDSNDEDFLKEKQELISQNLELCEQIQKGPINKEQSLTPQQEPSQIQIQSLQKEIEMLNQMIRQNDQEFTLQIQRYNTALFDMQETIRQYEVRLDKIRDYEATIDELEHKVIRLKQQKYRDDMLIDNMSKKIRFYEKERGGVDAFLSPRGNYSRKTVLSPAGGLGSRVFNQSLIGGGSEMKGKNMYGERLTSN